MQLDSLRQDQACQALLERAGTALLPTFRQTAAMLADSCMEGARVACSKLPAFLQTRRAAQSHLSSEQREVLQLVAGCYACNYHAPGS